MSVCFVCQTPTKKSCSICKIKKYCSKECQISDWKIHKKKCIPKDTDKYIEINTHLSDRRNAIKNTWKEIHGPNVKFCVICGDTEDQTPLVYMKSLKRIFCVECKTIQDLM